MSASHPYDIKLTPGYQLSGSDIKPQDQIDPSIRTIDGNITCISCHSLTSDTKRLLVTSVESGLCTGCHDMQRALTSPAFSQHE